MDSGVIALPRTNSHPDPGGGRGFYKLPAPFPCGLLERPIPRRAPTQGGDSPSIQFQGRDPLSAASVNTLPKSRSCSTCTASGAIAMHCPPPRRGREEAAERPGGGGVSRGKLLMHPNTPRELFRRPAASFRWMGSSVWRFQ